MGQWMVSGLKWDLGQVLHNFAVWLHTDSIPSLGSHFLGLCICVLNGQEVLGYSQPSSFFRDLRKLNVDTGMDTVSGKGLQTAEGRVRFQGWGTKGQLTL